MSDDVTIAWIHGDNLNPYQPALADDVPAIFVWDDDLLDEWDISFKRIVFIYECLLELPVEIHRGDVAAQVAAFAQAHNATRIVTAESPSPRFDWIRKQITDALPKVTIDVLDDPPFVKPYGQVDLKRFSRYWRAVKKQALSPTDDQS